MARLSPDDPLAFVLAPPPNENPEAKKARERAEAKARRVSAYIDTQLEQERLALGEKKKPVKVLLLGGSEIGRSTLLKDIQLQFVRRNWVEDRTLRAAWRPVIFLNLICNIIYILDTLLQKMADCVTDGHRLLSLRLAPLRGIQANLERRLGSGFPGDFSSTSVEQHDITDVLVGCKEDMKDFCNDVVVQQILMRWKVNLEDSACLFLSDIERIVSADYVPSDDDIVRAHLPTVGIQEYKFIMAEGREWITYDVVVTRGCRAVWTSYVDDVDSIIFLCPISCFDEMLPEDPRVSRLEDSCSLWRSICSVRMLAKAQIILLLDKGDLHEKLERGVRVRNYVRSFGDRTNDAVTVMKYFQSTFKDICKSASPIPRTLFVYYTSDTMTAAAVLSSVEESILRSYIRIADRI